MEINPATATKPELLTEVDRLVAIAAAAEPKVRLEVGAYATAARKPSASKGEITKRIGYITETLEGRGIITARDAAWANLASETRA